MTREEATRGSLCFEMEVKKKTHTDQVTKLAKSLLLILEGHSN